MGRLVNTSSSGCTPAPTSRVGWSLHLHMRGDWRTEGNFQEANVFAKDTKGYMGRPRFQ